LKRLVKILAAFSLLLSAVSFATCQFGVQYEINKIPPEMRSRMSDFDWIGFEWIIRGTLIFFVAVISAAIALSMRIVAKRKRAGTE
jgi:hypothetical protein